MERMLYQEVRSYSHDEVRDALERPDSDGLHVVVIGVALYDPDPDFVEELCLNLSRHANEFVRGNAIRGFGHLARRAGTLKSQRIKSIVDSVGMHGLRSTISNIFYTGRLTFPQT